MNLLELSDLLLQLVAIRLLGSISDAHLENLFCHGNLSLQIDFDISQVQTSIVAKLYAIERLLVKQPLDLIFVLLEFRGLSELLLYLVHKVVVYH